MTFDFLITIGIVILSVATIMEFVKEGIEWVGNKIKSKKKKEKSEVTVPATVWRVMAGALVVGTILLVRSIFLSLGEVVGLTAVLLNKWMMILWLPVVWWAQMQVDMLFIREHIIPMVKKGLENKLGAR